MARRLVRQTTRESDFETLSTEDIQVLRRLAVSEAHAARTVLFRQAALPDAMFIIEEGEVELLYETGHEPLIIQTVHEGSSVGDLPVMLGTPYPYTAATRTATIALRIDLEAMRSSTRCVQACASAGSAYRPGVSSTPTGGSWSCPAGPHSSSSLSCWRMRPKTGDPRRSTSPTPSSRRPSA